ncbi:hypothetical protein F3Y22_tig00012493pilonHSYRG00039 [Hibiscus syriacus]|uniref:RNase H type-1 domain-containing protein n=1 Tax=Hibiscus syriacus TaxID=106335 RepID=A0A6A3C4P8_HIBSY|nr:hypothetical protein F3Y22_tig00012493pilonHSYRG00039 [Hibiscus syriacus]
MHASFFHDDLEIWKRQNDKLFTSYSFAPPDVLRCAHHWAKLYGLGSSSSPPTTRPTITSLVWRKPKSGWLCLNSNGSIHLSTGIGADAQVIRNEEGAWIYGFSKNVVHSSILQAELWGIYEGLLLADSLDVERLEIQTDCKQAVKLLDDPNAGNSPISLVRAITTLRRQHRALA